MARMLLVRLVVASATVTGLAAASAAEAADRPAKVMTRNVYFGASLDRAVQASTPQEFLAAVSTIFTNSQTSDFPGRARSLAVEIAAADPAVVGVQEVALWRRGPVGVLDGPATPATEVVIDYLPILQAELAALGTPYDVVREQTELDVEGPAGAPYFRDVRLTSRDVILVRRGEVTVHSSASANFAAAATIPSVLGPLTVKSAWVAADVTVSKRSFRFVTTHLEPNDPFVRTSQAAELVSAGGPAASAEDPVVLVGDINSAPDDPAPFGSAYDTLIASGLVDTWVEANGSDPGFTHGFGERLDDPDTSGFVTRIDHVLTRGASDPARKSVRTGLDADLRTASGLWPSDHAGVAATVFP